MSQPAEGLPARGGSPVSMPELISAILAAQEPRESHRHDWAVVDLSHPAAPGSPHPRMPEPAQYTLVLLKCHCGEPKSVRLEGHWTMEQLMMAIGAANASSTAWRAGPEDGSQQ